MIYVVDANNLAGKLGLLEEKGFDQKLIGILNIWVGDKKHKVYLVFDGIDPMGDKYKSGKINVIYTPRDNYYQSADDKIVELIADLAGKSHEEIVLVTDDNEIINQVHKQKYETKPIRQINLEKATGFAEKLNYFLESGEKADDKNLTDREIGEINRELMKLWR
jgi:predicted RNA-binding protein with PIN domain